MGSLAEAEIQALAMHEIMKREQRRYADRVAEQQRINNLSDEDLQNIVYGSSSLPGEEK